MSPRNYLRRRARASLEPGLWTAFQPQVVNREKLVTTHDVPLRSNLIW